ncbi:MAG: reverse transcriptase domain-containing protein, partial [Bacteroidia bacterium]|nr:reverse transcriptase domain-containing protein [Bacteroidia bacterium]
KYVDHVNGLPQGAPTSPIISNLVLADFDKELHSFVSSMKGKYTRYSDDLTISFKDDSSQIVGQVIKFTEAKLRDYGFKLNKKKGKINILRSHQAQRICGITINSGQLSISRKQRRLIRSAAHNAKHGKDTTFTESQIKGHQSFHQYVADKGEAYAHVQNILFLEHQKTKARGIDKGNEFIVLRGSILDTSLVNSKTHPKWLNVIENLESQKTLKLLKSGAYQFKKNHTFESKKEATHFLHLKQVNLKEKWETIK